MVSKSISEIRSILDDNRIFLLSTSGRERSIQDNATLFSENTTIEIPESLELEPYSTFWGNAARRLASLGAFSYTHSPLGPSVVVGRYTSIATGLRIMGSRHPLEWISTSPVFYTQRAMMRTYKADRNVEFPEEPYTYRPSGIRIGNDCWIGENVTLGPGVSIGDGAVVASNSVITRDVESYTVVGGVPAKKIRYRFPIDDVVDLRRIRWWEYHPEDVSRFEITDPHTFCSQILEYGLENLEPFKPKTVTSASFQIHNH